MADPVDSSSPVPASKGADRQPEPDAHGQAALLLVESLIHGLIARSSLTRAEAVEIIEVAIDVKAEYAEELEESGAVLARSLVLIEAIGDSLRSDGRD